jgi:hypothetical protein
VRKYECEINPEEVRGPTIHRLRGTGILKRFMSGDDVGQISNDIGMLHSMVQRYMRFRDQMEVAGGNRKRLHLVP